MSEKNQRLDRLIRRQRLKRILIWGSIGSALLVGLAAFILLTRDPTTHVAFVAGTLDDTIVSEGYDGASVYWLVALPDGTRAQISQPPGAVFKAGRKVCLDVREGDWSGRKAFYLARPENCAEA